MKQIIISNAVSSGGSMYYFIRILGLVTCVAVTSNACWAGEQRVVPQNRIGFSFSYEIKHASASVGLAAAASDFIGWIAMLDASLNAAALAYNAIHWAVDPASRKSAENTKKLLCGTLAAGGIAIGLLKFARFLAPESASK